MVGVRLTGRVVRATVIERVGTGGSLESASLVRVKLGDPLDPEAPEVDVPPEWLEPVPAG